MRCAPRVAHGWPVVARGSVFSALLLCVVGCGPERGDYGEPGSDGGHSGTRADARPGTNEFADAAPQMACTAVDILFVIDDSGSMRHERDNLRANFPGFIAGMVIFAVGCAGCRQ